MVGLLKSQSELFNVLSTNNGPTALSIIAGQPIDLVITGLHLQEIDAYELVSRIDQLYPQIRVIVMTNNASSMLREKIKQIHNATHFDQTSDIGLLTKRIFSDLHIDYGGQICGIDLSSFLQIMELEGRTCRLRISTKGKTGDLIISEGRLVAAATGPLSGKSAALQIFTWEKVYIDIDFTPVEWKVEITAPLMGLLLESGKLLDKKQNGRSNRRKHDRCDYPVAVDYYINEWPYQCFLRDISPGGAYIETDQPIAVGQVINLTLSTPYFKRGCAIKSQVVRRDKKGIGIIFKNLEICQKEMLHTLIRKGTGIGLNPDLSHSTYIKAA